MNIYCFCHPATCSMSFDTEHKHSERRKSRKPKELNMHKGMVVVIPIQNITLLSAAYVNNRERALNESRRRQNKNAKNEKTADITPRSFSFCVGGGAFFRLRVSILRRGRPTYSYIA